MTDDRFEDFLRQAARDYNTPPPTPRDEMWEAISAARRARRGPVPLVTPIRGRPAWVRTGVGIAAILLIGVAIGRYSNRGRPDLAEAGAGRGTPVLAGAGRGDSSPAGGAPAPTLVATEPATSGDLDPRSRAREDETSRVASARAESRAEASGGRPPRAGGPYRVATLQHLVQAEVLLTSFRAESRGGAVDRQVATWARDLLSTTRLLLDSPASGDPQLKRLLGDLEVVLAQIAQLPAQRAGGEMQLIDEAVEQRDVITRLRTAIPAGRLPAGS